MLRAWISAACVVTSVACGGDASTRSIEAPRPASSGSGLERYFPLEDGKIYHYATRDGGETGMLVAKAHRRDASHGELRLSNATKRFVIAPGGIRYDDGGAYVLKAPIDVGTSWAGEHGGTTTIVATDASVEVPAGRFAGCVRTVEEGARLRGARYEATYCPGIGVVLLVVSSGASEGRAELKSYGLPVRIE